ncbi:MAG TPA: SusC/RagA family TonB-linked outer membrane protein [Gemmatimonadaceae bacterium]
MAHITLRAWPRRLAAALRLSALLLLLTGVAGAQQMIITGRVTSEAGQPVAGANVAVMLANQTWGGIANERGAYSFSVPAGVARGQTASISARFFGFQPVKKNVTFTGAAQTIDFVMKADPFRLSELVITGVATETSMNKVPFSIAKVSDAQMKEVPASSPVAALAGKVAGANVELGSGEPGAAPIIRLRGSTNLGVGTSSPLILMDGVITKFSISDIDASDVESIEVLKGAAAASFYGSDAANGVLNITTKRGKGGVDGEVLIKTRSEFGKSDVEHYVVTNHHTNYQLNADGSIFYSTAGTPVVKTDGIVDNAYPSTGPDVWRDQLKLWLKPGQYYSNNVQVSMKKGNTNFASSFTSDHDQGIVPMRNGFWRQTARLNVDQAINPKMDISASVTYGDSKYDMPTGSTGIWFPLLQAPPNVDLLHPDPTKTTISYFPAIPAKYGTGLRGNPLYLLSVNSDNFFRERFLGSAAWRYRPLEWLKLDASYGTDRSNRREDAYSPRGSYSMNNNTATVGNGSLYYSASNDVAENMQVNAIASHLWFGNLNTTTRASYLVEKFHEVYNRASGTKLNVSQVPDMAALDPTTLSDSSYNHELNSVNYMVSQAFDYKDRYVLDALYRKDGSSLFGPQARWADFYRVAGTYRLTEDFQIPHVQELRIRAAQGTAGLRPGFSDQYETYSLGNGTFSKNQLGNKNLKPAIQTEKEFGLNMQFLNRFDLEVVKADRNTVGAFLAIPLSVAQSGGYLTQVQNAATISAKTMEYSLQANLYDSKDIKWQMGVTADHTTQMITKLGRSAFRMNADGQQGQDAFYYKEGEPLGIIYGQKFVRNVNQLLDNPANAGISLSNYVVNPDGYVVLKSLRGTTDEVPIVYVDKTGNNNFVIGDVNPKYNFGVSNTFRFKSISVYALFSGTKGGDIYNFTKQWMVQDQRTAMQDQAGRAQADKITDGFYQVMYNGLVANAPFVEDGSYVKLRELSAAYTFSPSMIQAVKLDRVVKGMKFAVIGRNLKTWTKYSGFDPEVASGSDFNFRIDGFKYPNFRKITGQFELTF